MEREEDDERREAAIHSLQSNLKPRKVTQQQLSKFQELHRRRLQIKSKYKINKKQKDYTMKSYKNDHTVRDHAAQNANIKSEELSQMNSESIDGATNSFLNQDNIIPDCSSNKRQKLHWGLDTKERWERKANM